MLNSQLRGDCNINEWLEWCQYEALKDEWLDMCPEHLADCFVGDDVSKISPLAIGEMFICAMDNKFMFKDLRLDEFSPRTSFIQFKNKLVGFHYNAKGCCYFFYKKEFRWYIDSIIRGNIKPFYLYDNDYFNEPDEDDQ